MIGSRNFKKGKKDTVQEIEEESKFMQIHLTAHNLNCMGWLLVSVRATIISISSEWIRYSCIFCVTLNSRKFNLVHIQPHDLLSTNKASTIYFHFTNDIYNH